jgi:hypothetical protein
MICFVLIVAFVISTRNTSLNPYLWLTLLGSVEGIVLGCSQWLVLRQHLRHAGWWILATFVGAVIAWVTGLLITNLLAIATASTPPGHQAIQFIPGLILQGVGVGLFIGYAQWLVLQYHIRRQFLRKVFGWLGANALAWVLALAIAVLGVGRLEISQFHLRTAVGAAIIGGTMGLILGIVTGIALIRVLKPDVVEGGRFS